MQTHYGFIRSMNLYGVRTPYNFKNQFTIYSYGDNYLRKRQAEAFLRNNYSTLGYSHVLITSTRKPYTLAGDFVIPSRNNFQRFLSLLRVVKPNNSFLRFEAFYTGSSFQSSTLHESDEIPLFLGLNNDAKIVASDLDLVIKSMNHISRLKVKQKHRINNFYGYLEQSIRGPIYYRIIWVFIALESLFQLNGERGETGERISKRIAYYLESKDKKKRQDAYSIVYEAYGIRGELVHGGKIDDKKIRKSLKQMEKLIWGIANKLLLSSSVRLKRFTSEDELRKYFHWINYKWGP